MEEAQDLLQQLDLAEYIEIFKRNKITYTRLLQLTDEDLKDLIPELDPARDLKIYLHKLRNGEVFKCFICLKSVTGLNLLMAHLSHDHGLGTQINRKDRQCVVEELVNSTFRYLGPNPNRPAIQKLAQDLVSKYPWLGDQRRPTKGYDIYYCYKPQMKHPTGLLQENIQNRRKKFLKTLESLAACLDSHVPDDWIEENGPQPSVEISEQELKYMNANITQDSISLMRDSVFRRKVYIKSHTFEEVAIAMRRLVDQNGIIVRDFNAWYPRLQTNLYGLWPQVSETLIEYFEESEFNLSKKLNVKTLPNSMTEEQKCIVGLMILPFALPLSGRRLEDEADLAEEDDEDSIEPPAKLPSLDKPSDSRTPITTTPKTSRARKSTAKGEQFRQVLTSKKGKGVSGRICKRRRRGGYVTQQSALDHLLVFRPDNTNVRQFASENKKPSPFILVIGDSNWITVAETENVDKFFVLITKVAIPCSSFLQALDTCFKSIYLFNLEYPPECRWSWLFIQSGIFEKSDEISELPCQVLALESSVMNYIRVKAARGFNISV